MSPSASASQPMALPEPDDADFEQAETLVPPSEPASLLQASMAGTVPVSPGSSDVTGTPPSSQPSPSGTPFVGHPVSATNRLASGAASHTAGPPTGQPSQSPVRLLHDYEMLGELGRGGMGVVYRARHVELDRVVALKMILSGARARSSDLARFRIEARAVAAMQHPNIVQIYEIGERDGSPYFSLEFVEGGTLGSRLREGPLEPKTAAALMITLSRAMHYAHERGVVHRDLKPANVLMTRDGVPKVTDFGLAKRLDGDAAHGLHEGVQGTPMYMAPEQARGDSAAIGPCSDVYALGVILYELITGRPPFLGANVYETLALVEDAEPTPPTQLQPKVPRDLETICLKCLQKDAAARYDSAAALADDLQALLDNRPIQARPTPAWERALKWARRRPATAALVAVSSAAVVALVAGGFTLAGVEHRRAVQESTLRAEADQQRDLAEANEREARSNFRQAQEAVEVLIRVGQDRLRHEPRLEGVRRELLERALRFTLLFTQKKGDEPAVRWQAARANLLVGDIREMLSEHEPARVAYVAAEGLYKDLTRDFPDRADYRRELAMVYTNLSTVLQALNQTEEAERVFAEGLALAGGAAGPSDADGHLAATLNNRGILYQRRGDAARAEQAYARAATLFRSLARAVDSPEHRLEFARTLTNLAYLRTLTPGAALDEAEHDLDQAAAALTGLLETSPTHPAYRQEQGRMLMNRGVLRSRQGKAEAAAADYRAAAGLFRGLAGDFPQTADYPFLLALCLNNQGDAERLLGQSAEAVTAFREALKTLAPLIEKAPELPEYRVAKAGALLGLGQSMNPLADPTEVEKQLRGAVTEIRELRQKAPDHQGLRREAADAYDGLIRFYRRMLKELARDPAAQVQQLRQLATVYRECAADRADNEKHLAERALTLRALAQLQLRFKRHREAAEALTEYAQVAPPSSADYPKAAADLAQCVPLAAADPELAQDATERERIAGRYARQALDMLAAAAKAGWRDAEFLAGPRLEPLRGRPELKEALAALEDAAKGGLPR